MATIQEVTAGMQILLKYVTPKDHHVVAEHDVIYCGPDLRDFKGKLSAEDKKRLKELGWHEDSEGSCWAKFV